MPSLARPKPKPHPVSIPQERTGVSFVPPTPPVSISWIDAVKVQPAFDVLKQKVADVDYLSGTGKWLDYLDEGDLVQVSNSAVKSAAFGDSETIDRIKQDSQCWHEAVVVSVSR